eukprot:TRINITY_DN7919_c0_g6_i1.p1 TRINITY_DN7919_c0_g6~~TRINITY_DN7919_c0_g6_i1.p1  ORF type:complete len:1056 (-),score=263.57 TRINITY_DN7919_c0_g6_i1:160-3201(-)
MAFFRRKTHTGDKLDATPPPSKLPTPGSPLTFSPAGKSRSTSSISPSVLARRSLNVGQSSPILHIPPSSATTDDVIFEAERVQRQQTDPGSERDRGIITFLHGGSPSSPAERPFKSKRVWELEDDLKRIAEKAQAVDFDTLNKLKDKKGKVKAEKRDLISRLEAVLSGCQLIDGDLRMAIAIGLELVQKNRTLAGETREAREKLTKHEHETKRLQSDATLLQEKLGAARKENEALQSRVDEVAPINESYLIEELAAKDNEIRELRADLRDYSATKEKYLKLIETSSAFSVQVEGYQEELIKAKATEEQLRRQLVEVSKENLRAKTDAEEGQVLKGIVKDCMAKQMELEEAAQKKEEDILLMNEEVTLARDRVSELERALELAQKESDETKKARGHHRSVSMEMFAAIKEQLAAPEPLGNQELDQLRGRLKAITERTSTLPRKRSGASSVSSEGPSPQMSRDQFEISGPGPSSDEIESLRRELESKQEENDMYEDLIDTLMKQMDEMKSTGERKQEELAGLETHVAQLKESLEAQTHELQGKLQAQQLEVDNSKREVREARERTAEMEEELFMLHEHIAEDADKTKAGDSALRGEIQVLHVQIRQKDEDYAAFREEAERATLQLSERCESKEEELQQLLARIHEVEKEVHTQSILISQKEADVKSKDEELALLGEKVLLLERRGEGGDGEEQDSEVRQLRLRIASLEEKLQQKKEELDSSQSDLIVSKERDFDRDKLLQQIAEMETQVTEDRKRDSQYREKLAEMETQLRVKDEVMASLNQRVQHLEQDLRNEADRQGGDEQLARLAEKLTAAEDALEEKDNELKMLREKGVQSFEGPCPTCDDLRIKVEELEDEVGMYASVDLQALDEELRGKEDEIAFLHKRIQELENTVAASQHRRPTRRPSLSVTASEDVSLLDIPLSECLEHVRSSKPQGLLEETKAKTVEYVLSELLEGKPMSMGIVEAKFRALSGEAGLGEHCNQPWLRMVVLKNAPVRLLSMPNGEVSVLPKEETT